MAHVKLPTSSSSIDEVCLGRRCALEVPEQQLLHGPLEMRGAKGDLAVDGEEHGHDGLEVGREHHGGVIAHHEDEVQATHAPVDVRFSRRRLGFSGRLLELWDTILSMASEQT